MFLNYYRMFAVEFFKFVNSCLYQRSRCRQLCPRSVRIGVEIFVRDSVQRACI